MAQPQERREQISVPVDPDLRAKIERAAEVEHRTVAGQIPALDHRRIGDRQPGGAGAAMTQAVAEQEAWGQLGPAMRDLIRTSAGVRAPLVDRSATRPFGAQTASGTGCRLHRQDTLTNHAHDLTRNREDHCGDRRGRANG